MLMRCPDCHDLLGHDADDKACERCGASGFVEACVICCDAPQDALFAPACSGQCRALWEAKQPRPVVRKAP